ncbi:MAG: pullulanase-type alpha-1,6-glucosidase [Acidobacteriota bacterium]|nr:pullulanase-type alpha-1,6-glucosidase [Acidobacteriota bacterium]
MIPGKPTRLQAFWIDRKTVTIQAQHFQVSWNYSLASGDNSIPLTPTPAGLTTAQAKRYPQLVDSAVFQISSSVAASTLKRILKGQIALVATDNGGAVKYLTGVQYAGVLDDLFYYSGPLGVTFERNGVAIGVWAPTAQSVKLLLFDGEKDTAAAATISMSEENGVWRAQGEDSWVGKYYLLSVRVYVTSLHQIVENIVTDPYSADLALNGTKARITDVGSERNKPDNWDKHRPPDLLSKSDLSVYELHVRDFSTADESVPEEHRGTYLAFTDPDSNGMRHLRQLADAGLKAVHLLPTFHFASVNEDKSTWKSPGDLSGLPRDSQEQQAKIAAVRSSDDYNWGYDPVHYFAPEGAYARDPGQRVREYRQMVMGLHKAGLRVVQDLVFNHTNSSGQAPNSVLDKIVPNYYYRLDADGNVGNSSCCADTASEHKMMEKLMIDAVVHHAKEYKIDGFRFDLMGFHFVYNMQHIRDALAKLTLENDGVDGSKIYLYGEGWNFGETGNNQLGPNADQVNMYGAGIGMFNDRIRDAIRGGGPFDDQRIQGFATGLFTDSSFYTNQRQTAADQRKELLLRTDWIRAGLAGNLRDFRLETYTGQTKKACQIDYSGQGVGYTASPIENVNYCSVHDNQTLFDAVQLKSAVPGTTPSGGDDIAMRTRRQVLAMSLIALGQGIPFFQAGDDLLRSKDMDNNSYDSGDWFNKIDFTYQSANWGIGLPIASENESNWPIMQPLLANAALTPDHGNIDHARRAYTEFLRIRQSTRLFRMETLTEIQNNLHFLNTGVHQEPGLIVMKLDANGGVYGLYTHIVAVFNATTESITFQHESLKRLRLHLHPVQMESHDPVVRKSAIDDETGAVNVPALTTAVFVPER